MKIKQRDDAPPAASGYAGVAKQIVLGPADGSNEIVLRYFSVAQGGATPRHSHDFPHLVKVEAGRGAVLGPDGGETQVSAGDYVYVAPNETHSFKNIAAYPFEFICIVPARGEPSATDWGPALR
ncbi:MAG: cupin domain-containing protein [Actinomycetia bacterium]|nr:cupin domain-containing protein [Actinomycetes bacterium]